MASYLQLPGLPGADVSRLRGELRDPALESDYLQAVLDESRVRLRLGWLVVVATSVAYMGKDALSLEANGLLLSVLLRGLGVLPGLFLLVLSRPREGRDLQRRAFWACAAFLPSFIAVHWLYDEASLMSPLWFGVLALFNGLWMAHSFRNLVLLNAMILVSGLAVYAVLGTAALPQQVSVAVLLGTIFAWSIVAPSLLGAARRYEYGTLLSAFPASVVRRLVNGLDVAHHHDDVTVLFADLVGFTALAERLPAGELLPVLAELFEAFDELAYRHGVEPIKTVGDSYMAAAGVPEARPDHVQAAAGMALDMRRAVAERTFGGHRLAVRIGLHRGPLVAGVVRTRRQLYDLWGDTVNVASRLESHGEPGRIQVSGAVADVLGPLGYHLERRGTVELKGHEEVEAWFLEGVSPPARTG